MSTVTTTHSGVEITYDEQRNRWRFIVQGRERSSETLTLAKAAIDKPDPAEKPAFTKQQAWLLDHRGDPEVVTITALAEAGEYSGKAYYWMKSGRGRSKESASGLFEKSARNDALIERFKAFKKEASEADKKADETRQKLTPFTDKP